MRTIRKNRIRKSTKYTIVLIAIVLFIFSLSSFINNLQEDNKSTVKREIYNYTDKFHYDYKVNLIKNKYMTNKEVEDKKLAYVTDLIDNINLDLNYEYLGSEASDITYSYSIEGKMQVVYTKDGDEQKIWDRKETLLKEKTKEISGNNVKINKNLVLDLKDKNTLLNEFKQQLGMTINAKYTVSLKIKILTDVEQKEIEDEYVPIINIDLAEKTTKISGDNDTEKTEYVSKEFKVTQGQSIFIIILDLIMLVASVVLFRYAMKSKVVTLVRNEFKYELNRILKICQDKIVEVNSRPNDEEQEVVFVKDFGEIVKVSEELFKPILYYNKKDNEEAWFTVMSGKTSYRYVLKN